MPLSLGTNAIHNGSKPPESRTKSGSASLLK